MVQSAMRTVTLWEAVSRKFLRTIDHKEGMAGTADTLFAVGALGDDAGIRDSGILCRSEPRDHRASTCSEERDQNRLASSSI